MPSFRKKSRSGKPDKEKENATVADRPTSPRLTRCQSDSTGHRTCSELNSNNELPPRKPPLNEHDKLSNLMQLNASLIKEVSSLRGSQRESDEKLAQLEESFLQEKRQLSIDLSSAKEELSRLEEEKQYAVCSNVELSSKLFASMEREEDLSRQLSSEKSALANTEERLRSLQHEMEQLSRINDDLSDKLANLMKEMSAVTSEKESAVLKAIEIEASLNDYRKNEEEQSRALDVQHHSMFQAEGKVLSLMSELENLKGQLGQTSVQHNSRVDDFNLRVRDLESLLEKSRRETESFQTSLDVEKKRHEAEVQSVKTETSRTSIEFSGQIECLTRHIDQLNDEKSRMGLEHQMHIEEMSCRFKEQQNDLMQRNQNLEQIICQLETDKARYAEELEALKAEFCHTSSEMKSQLEDYRVKNEDVTAERDGLKSLLTEAHGKYTSDVEVLKVGATRMSEKFSAKVTSLEQLLQQKTQDFQALQEEVKKMKEEAECSSSAASVTISELRQQICQLQSELQCSRDGATGLDGCISKLTSELDDMKQKMSSLLKENMSLQAEKEKLNNGICNLKTREIDLNKQLNAELKARSAVEEKLALLKSDKESLLTELSALRASLSDLNEMHRSVLEQMMQEKKARENAEENVSLLVSEKNQICKEHSILNEKCSSIMKQMQADKNAHREREMLQSTLNDVTENFKSVSQKLDIETTARSRAEENASLANTQVENLRQLNSKLIENVSSLKLRIRNLELDNAQVIEAKNSIDSEQIALERSLDDIKNHLANVEVEKNQIHDASNLLEARNCDLENTINELKIKIDEFEAEKIEALKDKQLLEAQKSDVIKSLNDLNCRLIEVEKEKIQNVNLLQSEKDSIQNSFNQLQNTVSEIRQEKNEILKLKVKTESERDALLNSLNESNNQISKFQLERELLVEAKNLVEAEKDALLKTMEKLKSQLSHMELEKNQVLSAKNRLEADKQAIEKHFCEVGVVEQRLKEELCAERQSSENIKAMMEEERENLCRSIQKLQSSIQSLEEQCSNYDSERVDMLNDKKIMDVEKSSMENALLVHQSNEQSLRDQLAIEKEASGDIKRVVAEEKDALLSTIVELQVNVQKLQEQLTLIESEKMQVFDLNKTLVAENENLKTREQVSQGQLQSEKAASCLVILDLQAKVQAIQKQVAELQLQNAQLVASSKSMVVELESRDQSLQSLEMEIQRLNVVLSSKENECINLKQQVDIERAATNQSLVDLQLKLQNAQEQLTLLQSENLCILDTQKSIEFDKLTLEKIVTDLQLKEQILLEQLSVEKSIPKDNISTATEKLDSEQRQEQLQVASLEDGEQKVLTKSDLERHDKALEDYSCVDMSLGELIAQNAALKQEVEKTTNELKATVAKQEETSQLILSLNEKLSSERTSAKTLYCEAQDKISELKLQLQEMQVQQNQASKKILILESELVAKSKIQEELEAQIATMAEQLDSEIHDVTANIQNCLDTVSQSKKCFTSQRNASSSLNLCEGDSIGSLHHDATGTVKLQKDKTKLIKVALPVVLISAASSIFIAGMQSYLKGLE